MTFELPHGPPWGTPSGWRPTSRERKKRWRLPGKRSNAGPAIPGQKRHDLVWGLPRRTRLTSEHASVMPETHCFAIWPLGSSAPGCVGRFRTRDSRSTRRPPPANFPPSRPAGKGKGKGRGPRGTSEPAGAVPPPRHAFSRRPCDRQRPPGRPTHRTAPCLRETLSGPPHPQMIGRKFPLERVQQSAPFSLQNRASPLKLHFSKGVWKPDLERCSGQFCLAGRSRFHFE